MFIRDSRPTLTRKCALATYRKEVISCIPSLHCRPRGLALAWVNSSGSKPTGVSGRGCVHSVHDVLYVACSTPVGCTVCSNAVRIPHSATPCTQPCGPLPVLPSVYGRRCLSWPPRSKTKMNWSLPLPFVFALASNHTHKISRLFEIELPCVTASSFTNASELTSPPPLPRRSVQTIRARQASYAQRRSRKCPPSRISCALCHSSAGSGPVGHQATPSTAEHGTFRSGRIDTSSLPLRKGAVTASLPLLLHLRRGSRVLFSGS